MQTLSIDEQPPKIIKKLPEKIEPKEGELAKLEVKVIGKPKPKVKWLRDDEEIFASEEYQIENFEDGTSVLIINHVYPDDVGVISFEAHNPLGVAVTTALFAVEGRTYAWHSILYYVDNFIGIAIMGIASCVLI